ncbi:hypothetical protein SLA2020_435790 [Shorea laevis]
MPQVAWCAGGKLMGDKLPRSCWLNSNWPGGHPKRGQPCCCMLDKAMGGKWAGWLNLNGPMKMLQVGDSCEWEALLDTVAAL